MTRLSSWNRGGIEFTPVPWGFSGTDWDRFWSKVDIGYDHECWPWLGGKSQGYGRFHSGGMSHRAHRFVYALVIGPIPSGYEVDHVSERGCIRRDCVNPRHLEAVTKEENNRRAPQPGRPRDPNPSANALKLRMYRERRKQVDAK